MSSNLLRLGFLLSLSFCVQGQAKAAPQVLGVTGQLQHGGAITITGQSFGTKAGAAAPYRWDNFDDGTPGSRLKDEAHGGFTTEGTVAPVYSSAPARWAGSKSAYQNFTGGSYNSTIGLFNYPDLPMYFSGWFNYTMSGAVSRNNKLLQIRRGDLSAPGWEARFGSDSTSQQQYVKDCDDMDPPLISNYVSYNNLYADSQWHRMEFWLDQGTRNGNNGVWTIWIDGQVWATASGTMMEVSDCPFDRLYIGFYFATDVGSPTPEAQRYWDELYVDTTRSRVEIGDAATWSAITHREIQIPSSWSAASITATINKGSFSSGQQSWLYVVDSSGAANPQGYPVTFGGTAPTPTSVPVDSMPPSAPVNLQTTQ